MQKFSQLSRAEMKNVLGGVDGGGGGNPACDAECKTDADCPNSGQDSSFTHCVSYNCAAGGIGYDCIKPGGE